VDYETLSQAATRTGLDASTFRHAIADGKLAAIKPGRDWLVRPENVDRLIEAENIRPRKPHKKRRRDRIKGESEGE
jgi:excisionase family DNA binding protein